MKTIGILLSFIFSTFFIGFAFADDAEVLPKGVSSISINSSYYFNIDEQYDPDGDTEPVDTDFNSTLDSSVFPALSAVEAFFGMTAGTGNVGDSVVNFDYDFRNVNISYMYGITERLTAGIKIPYWWIDKDVDTRLDTTNATIGKSATGVGFAAPLVPLSVDPFGDAEVLTTEDILDLVSEGLDINGDGTMDINGYGYERISSFSYSGLGDIEIGARFQYLKTEDWRLAVTGGVTIPTGREDDPDDLMDYGISDGAYIVLLQSNNDYTGFKDIVLNGTLRYNAVLPNKEKLRIKENVDDAIIAKENKEKVDRDIGDVFEIEVSGKYKLPKGFGLSLLYKYGNKAKDSIDGDRGLKYDTLEKESDYIEHVYVAGLSYSTIPLFKEKKFPVPLNASVSYRDRFAGKNLFKSRYLSAGIQLFF